MEVVDITRRQGESYDDVLAMLEGQVFHVTRRANWRAILDRRAILPNPDGSLATTFGSSSNSFFRNRGCVSLFDYRDTTSEEARGFRSRCHPLRPALQGDGDLAILLLDPAIADSLIPWTAWKDEKAWREMVVPHVEAGHPGPIPAARVERVIFFNVEGAPPTLVERFMRKGRDEGSLRNLLGKFRGSKEEGDAK